MQQRLPVYLGYALLVFFIVQYALGIEWPYLSAWQQRERYRLWTGFLLLAYIGIQWVLTLVRIVRPGSTLGDRLVSFHRWLGAFTPLAFLLHASDLGFGYLLLLALTFFFNFCLGLLNVRVIRQYGASAFRAWFVTHVVASVLITALALLHLWVVFYYK